MLNRRVDRATAAARQAETLALDALRYFELEENDLPARMLPRDRDIKVVRAAASTRTSLSQAIGLARSVGRDAKRRGSGTHGTARPSPTRSRAFGAVRKPATGRRNAITHVAHTGSRGSLHLAHLLDPLQSFDQQPDAGCEGRAKDQAPPVRCSTPGKVTDAK